MSDTIKLPPGFALDNGSDQGKPALSMSLPSGFVLDKQVELPQVSALESFGRGAVEGATFGFDDKLGMDKDRREASRKANPWTHFAGELVGGIAPVLATGGGAAALKGGTVIASKAGQYALRPFVAAEANSIGQAAAQGVKLGASYGAVSGAGHAEDGEMLGGAARGAVVGGALGGVLGPVAHKIGEKISIARAARQEMANADTASLSAIDRSLARDAITPATLRSQIEVPQYGKLTTDQITHAFELAKSGTDISEIAVRFGMSPRAISTAVERFANQNQTPLSIVDRARLTGVAGGENTSWTLRAGMSSPGRGRAVAAEDMTLRQMDQSGRLVDATDRIVAAGDPAARAAAMKTAEDAAYRQAFQTKQPFNLQPIVDGIDQQYAGRSTGIASNMLDVAKTFSEKTPGRPPTYSPFKDLNHFQEAKLDLDQRIAESMVMGRATPLTKRLMDFKTQVMNEVSATNPSWRAANDMFAENAAARRLFGDAQTNGFRITPESTAELTNITRQRKLMTARSATPEAKRSAAAQIEMYKDGLAEAIRAHVNNKSETGDHVSKLLTPAAKHIMESVLGPKDGQKLITVLEQEQAITRSYRGLGGSQTTPLREAIDELNGPSVLSSAWDMANPKALLNALIVKGASKISEARNNRMVPMLVEADPVKQLRLLRDLESMRAARTEGSNIGLSAVPSIDNAMIDQSRPVKRPNPVPALARRINSAAEVR